jgi:hypothetical protein
MKLHPQCPDVLIIGGQRCGTTWLAEALRKCDGVWLPPKLKPEPKILMNHAFAGLIGEYYQTQHLKEALEDSGYNKAPDDCLIVDKTTRYLTAPGAPELAAELNPDMKILVMLRDPSDRAWSHWRYSFSEGAETSSFAEAVAAEPARALLLPSSEMHKYAYMGHGLFGFHLSNWMQHFPPEQFHVGFIEQLDEPHLFMGELIDFLNLDHAPDVKWPAPKNTAPALEDHVDQGVWDTQDMLLDFFRTDMKLLDSVLRGTLDSENPYLR